MNHLYTFVALDIARERAQEAERAHRTAMATAQQSARPNVVRRGLANGFAAVSRGSAAAVRRLDECVADDLSQAFAPGK